MASVTLTCDFDNPNDEAAFLNAVVGLLKDYPQASGSFTGSHLASQPDLSSVPADQLGAPADPSQPAPVESSGPPPGTGLPPLG